MCLFLTFLNTQSSEVNLIKLFHELKINYLGRLNSNQYLILFVNFQDFSCHLCLEDFLEFSNFIRLSKRKNLQVVCFFRRDYRDIETQKRVIQRWMALNKLDFPIVIDSLSLFERSGVTNTSVIFVDELLEVRFIGEFPLSKNERNLFKKFLKN